MDLPDFDDEAEYRAQHRKCAVHDSSPTPVPSRDPPSPGARWHSSLLSRRCSGVQGAGTRAGGDDAVLGREFGKLVKRRPFSGRLAETVLPHSHARTHVVSLSPLRHADTSHVSKPPGVRVVVVMRRLLLLPLLALLASAWVAAPAHGQGLLLPLRWSRSRGRSGVAPAEQRSARRRLATSGTQSASLELDANSWGQGCVCCARRPCRDAAAQLQRAPVAW